MNEKSPPSRVWDILSKVAFYLACVLGATAVAHEVRLSTIENNRFTDKDGMELERRIMQGVPPEWFREDVSEIKTRLDSIDSRLRKIETGK
ncbi:MAG: hypothetical protein GY937_20135 [bacterium]|nr:hypothetical protein [bacterium]